MSAAAAIDISLPGLLAEQAARHPTAEVEEAARETAEQAAARLRERFAHHPKQKRFWQSLARRIWALCTRRAGKSDGGVREWLAKAITVPGWRGLYVNETKAEARKIVWKNDLGQGWIDLLAAYGQVEGDGYRIGGVLVTKNETLLEINFSNGSQIAIFAADDETAIDRLRGQAKDEIWVDEAQKFTHLALFISEVASACVKDKRGRIRLTGTPSEDCAGYFYECSCEPESGDVPLKGWEGHRWSVVDNPGFGRRELREDGWYVVAKNESNQDEDVAGPLADEAQAEELAAKARWDRTAGEELELNGWTGEEPKFQREWLGKWVKADARFVYPVHAVPAHLLTYAPQRLVPNPMRPEDPPWLDFAAARADLPWHRRARRDYQWLFAVGLDFGYYPDPFAITVWAFTQELPDVYELFSWKATRVNTDDQARYIKALWDAIDALVVLVGDPAGKQDDFDVWRTRLNIEIEEANKRGKNTLEEFLANDIRAHRIHFREGSPLLNEMKHLVYLPTKPGKPREVDKHRKVNGVVHGDHCCDAGRYAYSSLTHFLARTPVEEPAPGTPEALAVEAVKHERVIVGQTEQRARATADADDARWGMLEHPEEDYGYEYGY